jgi:eukaryotic-like serine/threonine-protein kinase
MNPQRKTRDLPQVRDVLRMVRTGEPLTIVELVGEGGQGLVFRATLSTGAPLAVKWYRPLMDTPTQRMAITELVNLRLPHPAFLFPFDLVEATQAGIAGFGYVMPWMESRFITFSQAVHEQPLSLATMSKIARKLAEAFDALHRSGLCYRDINFGNLWIDPVRGDLAIIDNDNVGTDAGHASVWGSHKFMAPEVTRREKRPSTVSDLHSLAVLLFFLLMHGHPLDGTRVEESYGWSSKHRSEEELAMLHYGREPLFIFDEKDMSNRPVEGSGPANRWPFYPRFIRDLFTQAFTSGLSDASLTGRVQAAEWRDAMVQLNDLGTICTYCGVAVVFDPDEPDKPCWNCQNVAKRHPLLKLRNGRNTVLMVDKAVLSSHHVNNDRDYDTVAAIVEAHPRSASGLVLRNRSKATWTVHPEGEDTKYVPPDQAFAIRPSRINFGAVRGVFEMP